LEIKQITYYSYIHLNNNYVFLNNFNFGIFIFWEIIFNHQHCLFIYFLTRWPFQTPDDEVEASIFLLIGSCPAKAREFGHTSRLHGSRYKPTDLNHYVGHDLISHELQRFDYKLGEDNLSQRTKTWMTLGHYALLVRQKIITSASLATPAPNQYTHDQYGLFTEPHLPNLNDDL
jgi:hypothetical protein